MSHWWRRDEPVDGGRRAGRCGRGPAGAAGLGPVLGGCRGPARDRRSRRPAGRGGQRRRGDQRRRVVGGWESVDGFGSFLWDDGELTRLLSLVGPVGGGAQDINDHGVVVGRSPDPDDTELERAVFWR